MVSIHTPVWGVTEAVAVGCTARRGFNPHARVGRDCASATDALKRCCFNPHARVGRDVSIIIDIT